MSSGSMQFQIDFLQCSQFIVNATALLEYWMYKMAEVFFRTASQFDSVLFTLTLLQTTQKYLHLPKGEKLKKQSKKSKKLIKKNKIDIV